MGGNPGTIFFFTAYTAAFFFHLFRRETKPVFKTSPVESETNTGELMELNLYAYIILATLAAQFVVSLVANRLNINSLNDQLPSEFEGIYDAEKYARSQQYTRETTRFSLVVSLVDLAVLLTFWFAGGFQTADALVRLAGFGSIVTGLLFVALLLAANSLIHLPFSVYSTFVLEEKYGFNKTTWRTFVTDRIKGAILGALIGAPILAAILWFFESAGPYAWAYAWATMTVISIALQYIAPTWIMPLFNKFVPLEDGELKESIMKYASSVDFPLAGLFVMDGSKRSTKSNAFFTGFGKNKRIALFDTLIEKHTTKELVAVLAHEIGHYKKKHILKGMLISIVHTGALLFMLSIFLNQPGLYAAFGMEHQSIYAGLLFFSLLLAPVETVLSIGMNLLSRAHEFEADAYAKDTTGSGKELTGALKKLSVDNLSNLTPHPFYVFIHYSHPPVLERIRALSA